MTSMYAAAVDPVTAATALAVLGFVQIALLWKVARSTRNAADASARVAQLTSALALLTDTTEEGFVNVAAELGRLGARPLAPAGSRRATTKRIAAAAKRGRSVEAIAVSESLSESEVRLHIGLDAATTAAPAPPVEPGSGNEAGGLDELIIERWKNSLRRHRRAQAPRHAAVRV